MSGYAIVEDDQAPVVIGGVGGSGTRLVTQVLREQGIQFGGSLNESLDNLWYTLLFVRRSILLKPRGDLEQLAWLFTNAMRHGADIPAELLPLVREAAEYDRGPALRRSVLQAAADSLLNSRQIDDEPGRWGWKQPNSHVVIAQLNSVFPLMKYIYVVRNGLDMAFSYNQNQLQYFWGDMMLDGDVSPSPRNSLRYWVASYKRVLAEQVQLGQRLYVLDFDQMCAEPVAELQKLNQFLELPVSDNALAAAARLVVTPDSSGRSRARDYEQLRPEDLLFLRDLGYQVNT